MASRNVYNCSHFLEVLIDSKTTKKQRLCLLGTANTSQVECILEIVFNCISGNVDLPVNVTRFLVRYKTIFSAVSNLRSSYRKRLRGIRDNIFVIDSFFVKIRPVIRLLLTEGSK